MARLTIRKLTEHINDMFKRYELDWTVKELYKTKFRAQDYECGARIFVVDFITADGYTGQLSIFHWLKDIELFINRGGLPSLKMHNTGIIDEIFFI